uniref:Peptidase_S9 domain-containing protein n=1 Tax=Globodera pallida TaxID=36090 RepID=A0A183BJ72_GLOPA
MSSFPESTWDGYLQHVKFWRSEVKRSLGESISNVELVTRADGTMAIIGLATAPGDSARIQMVMQAEIPDVKLDKFGEDNAMQRPILELQPFIDPQKVEIVPSDASQRKVPPELALHHERKRGQLVDGVDEFRLHAKSGTLLFVTPMKITVFKNNTTKEIAQWLPSSAVLNVSFCETNPDYVAFTSHGQLFIDRDNSSAFESDASLPDVTNGVAAFVVQEEFERYDAYFWSPTRAEMVYERVDESPVIKLPFTLPSVRSEFDGDLMRYPLTGTNNAIVTLRGCRLDEQSGLFVDLALDTKLESVVPWLEYIVRLGWTADGDDVYALVIDRVQMQMAVLLIPRGLFVAETERGKGIGTIRTIYQESSQTWINANKLLSFVPPLNRQQNNNNCTFIIGSERQDMCHLYLHDSLKAEPKTVTSGPNWAVLKETHLKVDTGRALVFYLSNRTSPVLLSLCVSNYKHPELGCRVLTPPDMSYRFERSCSSLYLNPDIGFVCWLSSVQTLPECRLYRFVHSNGTGDLLPRAVFTHRIGVQVLPPSLGLQTSSWGMPYLYRPPADVVKPILFEYASTNSGKTHHALLLLPATREGLNKFPVIQAVYAGPSIQLVRNSWYSVCHALKFVAFGYAVLMVDGRGSANRGVQFESAIKQRMGSAEIDDQHEGFQKAAERFGDLLDMDRVAVIGWSYGGYASLLLLACYPSTYRCACVGGAVSDWHLYDTAYTERYMGIPKDNEEAYRQSALSSKVSCLPNQEGRLLIVHGMIDENVHFSHCAKLISALTSAQKPYQLLLFPGERHAIRNGEAIEFFHANILSFFARALSSPTTLHAQPPSSTAPQ